jgi:hypothetical protein
MGLSESGAYFGVTFWEKCPNSTKKKGDFSGIFPKKFFRKKKLHIFTQIFFGVFSTKSG